MSVLARAKVKTTADSTRTPMETGLSKAGSSEAHKRSWLQRKIEFPFYFYADGRHIHIVAELSDKPGTLARVLSVLATRVDFVGTTSYSRGSNRAIFSAVARLLSKYDSAQSIQELMMVPEGVIWSEVKEGRAGLLVDRFHVGYQTGNSEPLLLVPMAALSSMFQDITQRFGSGGEMILYNQGKAYSLARFAAIRQGLGSNPKTRFEEITAMTSAVGWAIVEAAYQPGSSVVEFRNLECFECSTQSKTQSHGCAFLRGMAEGLVEAIFRKEVTSEEIECKRRGSRACIFVVESRDGSPL